MHRVAFLDRDGVINYDYGYVHKKSNFKYIENAVNAMSKLNSNGYKIIIVTNQAGIAKGHFTEDEYHSLTEWYVNELKEKKVEIFDIFFCPYHIDKNNSFMVCDKVSDIKASLAAGIKNNFLIANESLKSEVLDKTKYVKSLSDAVNLVLKK